MIKIYNVLTKKVQKSYVWWHGGLMQILKEKWLALPKRHEEFGKFLQAKNSDFILECKMVELNKNKNSKQKS